MSFDTLAPFYRTMEFLSAGGKLQECRTAFLDEIPIPRNILLAGEGHGRFLPLCVERFPEARITVIDSSSAMLEIARRKVVSDKVTFLHADVLKWEGAPGAFDLIVTHFFLDCFPPEELAVVVSRLASSATEDANWLLADFQVPDGRAPSFRSRIILAMLYAFFRHVTSLRASCLTPPEEALKKAGFALHRRITRDWGLLVGEWWVR